MLATDRFYAALVQLADTLVDDFDLVEFLHALTEHAADASGAEAVGLMLLDPDGRLRYMASSNESGRILELLQLQNHDGPCIDCIRTGEPVVNADLRTALARWPRFASVAIDAGFHSVHAFPMRLRDRIIGTLNLFGRADIAFGDDDIKAVQALADIATIGLLQERDIRGSDKLAGQLQVALDSRIVVEQAKGAIAQSEGISVSEAFTSLRSTARSNNRRLVDVATEVIETMHGLR